MKKLCIFVLGALVGSGVTFAYFKMNEPKEVYTFTPEVKDDAEACPDEVETPEKKPSLDNSDDIMKAKKISDYHNYVSHSKEGENVEVPFEVDESSDASDVCEDISDEVSNLYPGEPAEEPYTINEDEYYATDDSYQKSQLLLYSDGVMTDELSGEIVDDICNLLGTNYKDLLMDFVDNEAFIRNEKRGTDYSIYRIKQNYRTGDE